MHGGVKVYRGNPAAARSYVETDHARVDDYYLAEGTGLAERFVATPDGVEAVGALDGDMYEAWVAGRDPLSGEPAVRETFRAGKSPFEVGPHEADLYVLFRKGLLGMTHERLGTVGPLPWRRTGGHTGDWGFVFGAGPGLEAGRSGITSSFDVVPTILDLLGVSPELAPSGKTLLKDPA